MYNSHPIRKQKARQLYLSSGKPNVLYKYPKEGNRNYSTPPDSTLLDLLENQLSWYDNTAYLSPATRALCDDIVLRSRITYDSTKILPGLEQAHTRIYKVLRVELFQWEEGGGKVEELQPPTGALSTIEKMVAKFQIKEGKHGVREEDNLLGEREVDISDSESENKAQIDASELELGDDGEFFEP
jgi:hypothetical protein